MICARYQVVVLIYSNIPEDRVVFSDIPVDFQSSVKLQACRMCPCLTVFLATYYRLAVPLAGSWRLADETHSSSSNSNTRLPFSYVRVLCYCGYAPTATEMTWNLRVDTPTWRLRYGWHSIGSCTRVWAFHDIKPGKTQAKHACVWALMACLTRTIFLSIKCSNILYSMRHAYYYTMIYPAAQA